MPAFDFEYLYTYMMGLPIDSPYLIHPYAENRTTPALAYPGCVAAAGGGSAAYSRQDVYDRVLLWRVPLIALWATTTLPALGFHTQFFTLFHLVADPIDSLWSLFYKLDLAKYTAARISDEAFKFTFAPEARDEPADDDKRLVRVKTTLVEWSPDMQAIDYNSPGIQKYFRDVIALIVTAYDEWGYGASAMKAMNDAL